MISDLKIKTGLERILVKKTEKKYVDVVGLTPAEIRQSFNELMHICWSKDPTEPVLCCGS